MRDRGRWIQAWLSFAAGRRSGRSEAGGERFQIERAAADACRGGQNVMPVLVDAVKDYVSLGEVSDVYRQVFGLYREPIIF